MERIPTSLLNYPKNEYIQQLIVYIIIENSLILGAHVYTRKNELINSIRETCLIKKVYKYKNCCPYTKNKKSAKLK